jgi:hypothetical protein
VFIAAVLLITMLSPVLLLFITVIVVLLLINVLDLSWLGAGDVHPCGAHKATGNEAGAVDVAEDKSHSSSMSSSIILLFLLLSSCCGLFSLVLSFSCQS